METFNTGADLWIRRETRGRGQHQHASHLGSGNFCKATTCTMHATYQQVVDGREHAVPKAHHRVLFWEGVYIVVGFRADGARFDPLGPWRFL